MHMQLSLMNLALPMVVVSCLMAGCDTSTATGAAIESQHPLKASSAAHESAEPTISPFQIDLLDLAFRAAGSIPRDPHIKDRSRMQELVVATWMTLDQPDRALVLIPKIDNWRRGACYAELALYEARRGNSDEADRLMALAEQVAESADEWRRDTLNVKLASVHAWLGRQQRADQLESGAGESEIGKVDAALAARLDETKFDEQLKEIDERRASGHFDVVRNALDECVQLFDRFYANEERRAFVEARVRESLASMPVSIRLDLLMHLCRAALKHEDKPKALALVNDAQKVLDSYGWLPEDQIPLQAKLIALRHAAGDMERATGDAAATLVFYERNRERIVDVFRAAALRPLAEAFHAMRDSEAALNVYKAAAQEGAVNPNSRPRAEDLTATCCSMAAIGFEPDAELWSLMRRIVEDLRDPW